MKIKEMIKGVDWKLFRKQKQVVNNLCHFSLLKEKERQKLEGILNMMDNIQDCAVDELKISEKKVFNHKKNLVI